MIPFAIGVVAGLTMLQASIAAPRQAYTDCLKQASLEAAAKQVAAGQYSTFANQHCSSQAASFKGALVAFDVKNGVKRSQASSDAQLQLDDYLAMSQEKYESKVGKGPAQAQPQAVQAAAPVQPQN